MQGFAASGANSLRPHAVITTSDPAQASFGYDPNGNMTTRMDAGVTYTHTWDAQNRMAGVSAPAKNTAWVYDPDGARVSKNDGAITTVYIGDAVEVQISGTMRLTTTYYFFGGARIAMQKAGALTYLHGDRIGSASLATDASGNTVSQERYYVWGSASMMSGTMPSEFQFQNQRRLDDTQMGRLYDFNARFFSPVLANFISPDSIVPNPADPQSLNRYAAMANNPLKFTDPTGHMQTCEGCDGNGYNPVSLYHEWTLGYYDRGTLRVAFHHYYRANPARSLPSPRRDARGGTRNAYNEAAVDGKRDAEAEQGYVSAESVAHWDDRFAQLSQDQGDIHRAQTSLVMAGQASRSVAAQFEYNTMALAECSFSAGTPIATEAGMLAISSVVTGTRVLGWDETTNTTGYYRVTHLWVHEDPVLVMLVVNGETITTTPEHPFYAPIRGWLPAGELLVGIGVRKADGGVGIVDATTTVTRTERMWNLTVDEAHTYFVGDEQVLVHNDCLTGSNGRRYPRDYQVNDKDATASKPATRQLRMGPFPDELAVRGKGMKELGPDPVRVEPSKWRNQDSSLQFRTNNAPKGWANLEGLDPETGRVIWNKHLWWVKE
ncbi:MAG: polymorphic toxin-type HINT domain-containing protein [Thermoflexales bacterium]